MTGSGRPCMREKFLTTEITISTLFIGKSVR
jgi:hypothetical protein